MITVMQTDGALSDDDFIYMSVVPAALFPTSHPDFKYVCYQLERAPSTNRLHIQAFMQWRKCVSFAQIREVTLTLRMLSVACV